MRTQLWEYVGHLRLMICVQSNSTPADADWDAYASDLHALYPAGRLRRILVFGDGEGPNACQRKKLHHKGLYADHPIQTAVVTHSMLARGIVTAISWFTDIKAFAPAEITEAFRYLDIPSAYWDETRRLVANLRVQLSTTESMALPFDLSETIGQLDELLTDRLPKLRERIDRARREGLAKTSSKP